jgi:flavodoxin
MAARKPKSFTALVVYASNSGNTRMVAERVGERLRQHGAQVTVRDVYRMRPADLRGYDLVVFGSCTWLRIVNGQPLQAQLPEYMHRFAESAEHTRLPGTRFAVFALGRHEYTGFAGAANHLRVLVHKLGGTELVRPLLVDGFPHHQLEAADTWADQLMAAVNDAGSHAAPAG